ncbi:MAG: restriction endonuclease [Bryobacteraceae bacterium]|nr:restriction endonuclease [Bryobacteraceae bacterium]
MKKKVEVVQATIAQHYHVVPSELARVTITPEIGAIFEYLSRIGSDRFVDFVSDILVHVDGHTLVDKTDGSGDEKQDILTMDPAGRRHLVQCKHTINYGNNTSGNELDVMLAACLRKKCRSALWVTNADLTVQAKRYINDSEYLRGWPEGAAFTPAVDYWNGERLWQRVAKNSQILNKWFGGMAQSHGLRSFFTDLVILKMPSGDHCDIKLENLAARLKAANGPPADGNGGGFSLNIDRSLSVTISDSFATPADLRLPFSDPRSASMPLNTPFKSLRVHATIAGDGVYDPDVYCGLVVAKVGAALPKLKGNSWWYLAAAPPQAFVFLQDIAKPVLVPVGDPKTFVRVGSDLLKGEVEWALEPGTEFTAANTTEEEDEMIWRHETTGADLHVLVGQALPAWRVAETFLRHDQIKERLATMSFWVIENAQGATFARVRNLCPTDWPLLQSSSGDLFWAHPQDKESKATEAASALERLGITCLRVSDEDRNTIIGMITATPNETDIITSSRHDLLTPMRLAQRTFWLTDRISYAGSLTRAQWGHLLQVKVEYEARHGYDLLQGKDSPVTIAGEEMPRILGDLLTIRASRMLDLLFSETELQVNIRIVSNVFASGETTARECVREMALLKRRIETVLRSKK